MSEKKYWLDDPRNRGRIFYALAAVCALLAVADFFYEKHAHFAYEEWFGFTAAFGFVAYVTIVVTAKVFRRIVRRKEDYYDE